MQVKHLSYVEDALKSWPEFVQKKFVATLDRLQKHGLGPLLRVREVTKMPGRDNLYEIREKDNKICYRILFTVADSVAWLVHAFRKKSGQTPLHDLDTGEARAKKIHNQS